MAVAPADAVLVFDHDNWLEMPLKSFSQVTASPTIPRIASSAGETNLDGTHHYTFPVTNGFSKILSDDNKNYRVYGNYNPVDGTLYAPLAFSSISTGSAYLGTTYNWSAKVSTHKATYLAFRENATNRIYQIDTAGTLTALTLPAGLSGAATAITGMTVHKTYLYVATMSPTTSVNCYRFAIDTATWQDISGALFKFFTIRGLLYGVSINGEVWSVTGEEAAGSATYTSITRTDSQAKFWDETLNAVTFNGAAWIAKESGIYRFDGVIAPRVLEGRFNYITEYNGALYMEHKGWLVRFNGSLYEKLEYFGSAESIIDLQTHAGNLMILTRPDISSYKYGGSSSDGSIDNRIFEFDGVNFRVIYEADESTSLQRLSSTGDRLLMPTAPSAAFAASIKQLNFASRYTAAPAGSPKPYIITADFDGDLPNIDKNMRRLEVDVDNLGSSDTITVQYETYHYVPSQGVKWEALETESFITASSVNYIQFPTDESGHDNVFRTIRLKVTLNLASGSTASLKSVTIHYTVHPSHRHRFTLTTAITNNLYKKQDGTDYELELVGDLTSHTPTLFQAVLDKAFLPTSNKMFFLSPISTSLVGSWTAGTSDTSLTVNGSLYFGGTSYPYHFPLIAVKNNSNYWNIFRLQVVSVGSTTTIYTISEDDPFEMFNSNCANGAEVRLAYMVTDMQIQSQNFILDETTASKDSYGLTQLERDITLTFREV